MGEEPVRRFGASGAPQQAVPSRLVWFRRVLLSGATEWLAVGILMCLAAALTEHLIGAKSLWLDEGMSARIAQLDPVDGVLATYATPTPGAIALYYLLVHFWSAVSNTEAWLRMFSATCAVAAIPLVYMLSTRLIGRAAGLTAAIVVALSPFVVAEGQQARPYALVILLSTVLTLVFYSAMKSGGLRSWLLYATVAVAGMYVHTTVAYLVASQGAVAGLDLILFRRQSLPTIAARLAAAAIIVLACLPLAGQFLVPTSSGLDWIAPPTIQRATTYLRSLTGGESLLAVTTLSVLATPLVGWSWLRRGRGLEFSILIASSVAPIVLELLVSLVRPMFLDRYLAMSVPGLALVIAAAVELLSTLRPARGGAATRRWPRPSAVIRAAACAVIVVLSLSSVGVVYGPSKEDWRGAVEMIAAEAQPGDAVVVYPGPGRVPFDYYAIRQPVFRVVTPVFPEVGWDEYFPSSGPSLEVSLSEAKHTGRVWLVYVSNVKVKESDAQLLASYLAGGTILSRTAFIALKVELVAFSGDAGREAEGLSSPVPSSAISLSG